MAPRHHHAIGSLIIPETPAHHHARRLRLLATGAERKLWAALRSRQMDFKFRRQHPIPPYTADFACIEARLVVEVDGGQHGGARDAVRDAAMEASGWQVRRYWNSDVMSNTEGVLADIVTVAKARARR